MNIHVKQYMDWNS